MVYIHILGVLDSKKEYNMNCENLLEKLQKNQLLDFYLVSLISSDTIIDKESGEKSLEKIRECKELLKTAKLDNKDHYEKIINDGEKIIIRDIDIFSKKIIS